MPETDIDLDALAPPPKRVKLAGRAWRLPGDMPMGLFVRTQGYEARVTAGEDEAQMLFELQDEILALFQVHQPDLKELPAIGLTQLLQLLGQVYGPGDTAGEATPPNRAARRARTRTPSSTPRTARSGSSR